MAFFEKLTRFFRGNSVPNPDPAASSAAASPAAPVKASRSVQPPARPETAAAASSDPKESFLAELRSIPTHDVHLDHDRDQLLDDLKRLRPDRKAS